MGLFRTNKNKDKKDIVESPYLNPPNERDRSGLDPNYQQPTTSNSDMSGTSGLSSADTRVNYRDGNGNNRTVVTTTTTTTVTTTTSDGRVITEQHQRPASELPADRPRSPSRDFQPPRDFQSPPQMPVQPSAPNIPNRDARRSSHPESLTPGATLSRPYESAAPPPAQYQSPTEQNTNTSPTGNVSNFSRPGGRRDNIKSAALGLHGTGETLRGAINKKASELMHDSPETIAKQQQIRDQGLREVRSSDLMSKFSIGNTGDGNRLKRRSGNFRAVDERSRNF